ncbi:NADP-dependent oxidoreductase [Aeromicrobium fastidiosum]|uniref:NADP-dependent oxidoreductase n=1 Tax=Aeromicrobium fastidiosum TaxID=52699 RepID=A0A641AKZ3_9ACTN|nr:NADP-dependent oxidoreductase [Aeromicrobium fastidiosum]KAA1376043.1 NADP-dependent oxidoreductase [Aeromicrobium fastidiosum]MBP2392086.1 NADPH:quinone reductase-like Zn-dependent oxidoreductase [Aeromicrobium fastidiosum]
MKAITYSAYGNPLELTEVDEPKIGPDWVKVAVKASSVNPVDWKIGSGGLDGALDTFFPVTPGWDVAGVVEAVGPAVTTLAPGDEVFGYVRKDAVHGGTYAQKVSAPIRTVTKKPQSLSFAEAAAVPLAGLTAYQSLVHHLDVKAGETVLIHAASGGVGLFAVQIARALGLRVLGTASEVNHDYLRALDVVPFTYGDGLVERVRAEFPDGVDAVLDLNGSDLAISPGLLADSSPGRIASVIDPVVKDMGGHYVFVTPDADDLDALAALADDGKLTVEIAATFALADAQKAWDLSQEGHTRGKIVITVD